MSITLRKPHVLRQEGGDVPQARAAGRQGFGQVRGRALPRTGEHIRDKKRRKCVPILETKGC
jgi:hypothetical protein